MSTPSLPAVMRPGCGVELTPPSSAEGNNEWNHTSIPLYAFMVWTGQLHIFIRERSMTYPHKGTSAHTPSGKLRNADLHSVCHQYGKSTPYCLIMSGEIIISQKRDVLPTNAVRSNFAPEHVAGCALATHLDIPPPSNFRNCCSMLKPRIRIRGNIQNIPDWCHLYSNCGSAKHR
jgi:hypothetical protein